jgi:hypothetical protein
LLVMPRLSNVEKKVHVPTAAQLAEPKN